MEAAIFYIVQIAQGSKSVDLPIIHPLLIALFFAQGPEQAISNADCQYFSDPCTGVPTMHNQNKQTIHTFSQQIRQPAPVCNCHSAHAVQKNLETTRVTKAWLNGEQVYPFENYQLLSGITVLKKSIIGKTAEVLISSIL